MPAPGPKERSSLTIADPRRRAEAAPVVERFRASGFEPEGYTLYAYGAVQVWAQAAEKAGSLELQAMIAALREHQFDTVLGPIDFDEKGDLTVQNPVWYVWRDGTYVPLEQTPPHLGPYVPSTLNKYPVGALCKDRGVAGAGPPPLGDAVIVWEVLSCIA